MNCKYTITAKENGEFLIEGEEVYEVIKSGAILRIKSKADTINLTLIREKTESLNTISCEEKIACWIIANNGCGFPPDKHISCRGNEGLFNAACPLYESEECQDQESIVKSAKEWLERLYNEKAESTKKHEQDAQSCFNKNFKKAIEKRKRWDYTSNMD